jgi:hypothetical protein
MWRSHHLFAAAINEYVTAGRVKLFPALTRG